MLDFGGEHLCTTTTSFVLSGRMQACPLQRRNPLQRAEFLYRRSGRALLPKNVRSTTTIQPDVAGFRFIRRWPDGKLQAAHGQALIPSEKEIQDCFGLRVMRGGYSFCGKTLTSRRLPAMLTGILWKAVPPGDIATIGLRLVFLVGESVAAVGGGRCMGLSACAKHGFFGLSNWRPARLLRIRDECRSLLPAAGAVRGATGGRRGHLSAPRSRPGGAGIGGRAAVEELEEADGNVSIVIGQRDPRRQRHVGGGLMRQ